MKNIDQFEKEGYLFINYVSLPKLLHKQVYEARISDEVRVHMVNSAIFSYHEHLAFVESLRNSPDQKVYWAVCKDNSFLLSISLHPVNWEEGWGEWGIYVNPQYKQKGIAKKAAILFFDFITSSHLLNTIKAKVKKENVQSIKFHHSVGFITVNEDEKFIYLENHLNENRRHE